MCNIQQKATDYSQRMKKYICNPYLAFKRNAWLEKVFFFLFKSHNDIIAWNIDSVHGWGEGDTCKPDVTAKSL